jgi:hypothetical protein
MTQLERRKAAVPARLLQTCEERGIHVTSIERKVLKGGAASAVYGTIADTQSNVLVQDARAIITNVMRDLGISRQPDAYDGARFVDILKEYFGYMTIVDVKQAFEMFVMQELDDILPKGKDGSGLQHYQQFSASFYTKVLQAYRNKQLHAIRSVEGRVNLALVKETEQKRDPSQDKREVLRILEAVAVAYSRGEEPLLIMTALAETAFKNAGLLPKEVVPSEADVITARQLLSRNKDQAVSSGLKNAMANGHINDDLYATAANTAAKRMLRLSCEALGEVGVKERFRAINA